MSTAISTARKELEFTDDINEVQYRCKVAARFSGSLRKNIIKDVYKRQILYRYKVIFWKYMRYNVNYY